MSVKKIRIRRGLQADLPALDIGEFGFTTDTNRLYIGSATGNLLVNPAEQDPVFLQSIASLLQQSNLNNWNAAYDQKINTIGFDSGTLTLTKQNESTLSVSLDGRYLQTESDPTVPSHVKSITETQKSNWDSSYEWGDHSEAGYLTSLPEHNHDSLYSSKPVLLYDLEALNPTGSTDFFESLYTNYNIDSSYKSIYFHYEIKACSTQYGCFNLKSTPMNVLLINGNYSTPRYEQGIGPSSELVFINFSINNNVLTIEEIEFGINALSGNSESLVRIKIYGIK